MSECADQFMRHSDAFSWYMENDPALRSTIVAVAWLDQLPDWDRFVDKVDRASRVIPLFRMRLVEPPARLAPPRWAVDPGFDLSWHVRRVDAPPPHTRPAVMELARNAAMTGFDHARPLWEFTLVGNLRSEGNDGAALIMKIHHSLTDGVGGMQLALQLFDLDTVGVPLSPTPDPPDAEPMRASRLLRESVAHDWQEVAGFVRHQSAGSLPALARFGRHPGDTTAAVVETMRSIGRTVAPVADTLSPVMRGRGLARHLAMVEVSLRQLKAAGVAAGGSINDAFMAGVLGGLRRYHHVHGETAEQLRVTLPISIRTAADPVGGNRITLQRFTVPVGLADPAARIAAVGACCRAARDERSLPLTNAIAGALNLLPPGTVGGMLKHVDFVASDVPGFQFPVFLAGARMTGYFAFGPTIGTAFNVTLLSYDGTCHVGLTLDRDAIADTDVFVRCLQEGFDEVLALAPPVTTKAARASDQEPVESPVTTCGAMAPVR
jgi:WS/DGAT/MGAT family acyltransferase